MRSGVELRQLDKFLKILCKNLFSAIKMNIIPPEWLNEQKGAAESALHSRVWGMLAKTGFELGYVVEINAGFKPINSRQFLADIQLWKSNRLIFLIEYESTYASDLRILRKDLQHYVDSAGNSNFPDYWLVIYTLPDHAVGIPKSPLHRLGNRSLWEIRGNPHKYYKKVFENPSLRYSQPLPSVAEYIDNNRKWNNAKIFFVNLSEEGLEIDFPKRLNRKYLFGLTSEQEK